MVEFYYEVEQQAELQALHLISELILSQKTMIRTCSLDWTDWAIPDCLELAELENLTSHPKHLVWTHLQMVGMQAFLLQWLCWD